MYNFNRLDPEDSYINGHVFTPHCVYAGQMATVCRCVDGHSLFNCTTDDNQEEIRIFRTDGTDSCSPSDGFVRRRKRDVAPSPPPLTWPTSSGITEQQAREACLERMGSSAAYDICSQHVDLEPVVTPCVLNIQACIRSLSSSHFLPSLT